MSKYSIALLGASLAAVALLQFSPLQAQTKSAGGAPSDDQVVAIVKGSKVLFRDLRLAQENLPPHAAGSGLQTPAAAIGGTPPGIPGGGGGKPG